MRLFTASQCFAESILSDVSMILRDSSLLFQASSKWQVTRVIGYRNKDNQIHIGGSNYVPHAIGDIRQCHNNGKATVVLYYITLSK